MNRYMVFAYDQYYPMGGFRDFIGSCDQLNDAIDLLFDRRSDHGHIVDRDTGRIVKSK